MMIGGSIRFNAPVARNQVLRLHSTLPTEKQQQVFRTGRWQTVAMEKTKMLQTDLLEEFEYNLNFVAF